MKITVRYFALLRERRVARWTKWRGRCASTVELFREHLAERTPALAPLLRGGRSCAQ